MQHFLTMTAVTALVLILPAAVPARAEMQTFSNVAPPPSQEAASPVPAQADRFARARANLVALREGRIAVSALSPEELQDVIDLDRAIRGGVADTRTPRQQCIDNEVRSAGGKPSRLAWRVIELKCRD